MTTFDLSRTAPAGASPLPPPSTGTLEGLPRRLALTLAELRLVAERAGGAPLPFDVTAPTPTGSLDDRLGVGRVSVEDQAYLAAVAALHDPAETLARRGLLTDGAVDERLLGALGLLAAPTLAVDLDVTVDGVRARAWHRQSGPVVATLATTDGIVFELAWFDTAQWPDELGRVAEPPSEHERSSSGLPDLVDLPFELVDGCGEALRTQRADLVPVLVSAHSGTVLDEAGRPVPDAVVGTLVTALVGETRGRLRALAAEVARPDAPAVGVVSWILLGDSWRALRAHQTEAGRRLEVRRVQPADLGALLAPVLTEVSA